MGRSRRQVEIETHFQYAPVCTLRRRSAMSSRPRTLNDLAVGGRGRVRHVGCARASALRLLEMGLVPGTEVELVRRAPLGDPLELRVRGYSLSIRGSEARDIELEPSEAAS
ncbi:MAG TPA: FeoA family protein [Polyangiaceae bacterium]|nr:FeoA family protein [Polyangiaceae bacterium]